MPLTPGAAHYLIRFITGRQRATRHLPPSPGVIQLARVFPTSWIAPGCAPFVSNLDLRPMRRSTQYTVTAVNQLGQLLWGIHVVDRLFGVGQRAVWQA